MCEEKYGVSMTFEFLIKMKEERSFKVASVDLIMRYLTVLEWRYRYELDGGKVRIKRSDIHEYLGVSLYRLKKNGDNFVLEKI